MTLRTLVRLTATAATLGVVAAGGAATAAMSPSEAEQAVARMTEMRDHVDAWEAANPGQQFTQAQFDAKWPLDVFKPAVFGFGPAGDDYCLAAFRTAAFAGVDMDHPENSTVEPSDLRLYDSTTRQFFTPTLDEIARRESGACVRWIRATFPDALPPTGPPQPDPAAVVTRLRTDAKKAGTLVHKAQKKKASARPTLAALRKAGLKVGKGNKLTVRYAKRKPRTFCVRGTHASDGLSGARAVWYDSGTRKVTVGARPKGARSACRTLF